MVLTSRGGSAAGPKPGRASFYGELGRWKRAVWEKTLKDFSAVLELPHISCNWIA